MFFKLLALFTIVPLIELALLIPLGMEIGLWPTIGLVVGTALLGAVLSKLEGGRTLAKIKKELSKGNLPTDSILDGLAILVAAVFLITPGVLTDIVAIALLIPPVRVPIRAIAKKRFKKMLDTDSMTFISPGSFDRSSFEDADSGSAARYASPFGPPPDTGDIIDVSPGEESDDQSATSSEVQQPSLHQRRSGSGS